MIYLHMKSKARMEWTCSVRSQCSARDMLLSNKICRCDNLLENIVNIYACFKDKFSFVVVIVVALTHT